MKVHRGPWGSYSSSPCVWQFSKLLGGLFSSQSDVTSHSSLPSKQYSSEEAWAWQLLTAVGADELLVVLEAVDVEGAVPLLEPVATDEATEVKVVPELAAAEVAE